MSAPKLFTSFLSQIISIAAKNIIISSDVFSIADYTKNLEQIFFLVKTL